MAKPPARRSSSQDIDRFLQQSRNISEFVAKQPRLLFAIDATGSMVWVHRSVRERMQQLASYVRNLVPLARFGIIAYRDYSDHEFVTRVSQPSFDILKARQFMAGIDAVGGGDIPEAVVEAESGEVRAEAGLGRSDAKIGGQREPEPATDRCALHRRDNGSVRAEDPNGCRIQVVGRVRAVASREVGAGAEVLARRTQHCGAAPVILIEHLEGVGMFGVLSEHFLEDTPSRLDLPAAATTLDPRTLPSPSCSSMRAWSSPCGGNPTDLALWRPRPSL